MKDTSWAFVHSIAVFAANQLATTQSLSNEAQFVAQLALSEVQAASHGAPTLVDARQWAAQFFPVTGSDAIQSVTGVVNAGVPEWQFVIRGSSGPSTSVRCTNRGRVTAGDGIIEVAVVTCPSRS